MSLEHAPGRQRAAQTIPEFCDDNRISRSKLYDLWKQGKGPRFFHVGTKVLISCEASAAWRSEREAESNPTAA